MIGFVIFCIVGFFYFGIGIAAWRSEKPAGFWSNVKMGQVSDTRKYNHAMRKLWCVSGVVFILAKQRAKRTCLHVHLATAAESNTPPLGADLLERS